MTTVAVTTKKHCQVIRIPFELKLTDNIKQVDIRACGCERIILTAVEIWACIASKNAHYSPAVSILLRKGVHVIVLLNEEQVADDFMEASASQDQMERDVL